MKKYFTIIIVFLMFITLIGCSGTTENQEDEVIGSETENDVVEDDMEENEEEEEEDDTDDIVMAFKIKELPEGYPEDIVPIIDSGDLNFGANDGKEILAKVYCKEEPSKVVEYYLGIMGNSEGFKEDNMGGVYFLDGIMDGYDISIKITEDTYYEGYLTSLTIVVK